MISISRVLAVSACFAALVAAGCGSDDDDTSSSTAASKTSSTTSSTSSDTSYTAGLPKLDGQKAVYVGYGGISEDTVKKVWLGPFDQATGSEMTYDSPSDAAKVKAMVQSGNVKWDLIDLDGGSGATGCGTLFKTRQEMGIDVGEVDPKFITDDCMVPIQVTTQTLVYNKEKYKDNPPTKVTDFLDTAKFPGKRALFNYSIGALEPLELAAGTAPDKIYPYDYAVVRKAYDKLKSDIVLQDELAQQGEQLASGNFDMCMCYTGRAAVTPGIDPDKVGVVWDHAWLANDGLYAIKGSKVPELQKTFLNWVAKNATQNAFTEAQPYGTTTTGPKPNVPEKFKYWMPEFNESATNGTSQIDYKYLGKPGVTDKANSEWTAITSG